MRIEELIEDNRALINRVVEEEMQSDADYMDLVENYDAPIGFTPLTLEDFDAARRQWNRSGSRLEGERWRVYFNAQAVLRQRSQDIAVIDCGDFRAFVEV